MFKRTMLAVGVIVFTLLSSGCGQKSSVENKIKNELEKSVGGEVNVEVGDKKINIQTEQGSLQVGGKITLPKNFPSDVYVIDGELMSVMDNVKNSGYQIAIKANLSLADASKLYQTKLKEQGWKILQAMDVGTASIVMAQKDNRQLTVAMGKEEGKEGLAVMLNLVNEQFNSPSY